MDTQNSTSKLRTWLSSRKASMENERSSYEALWKELREVFEPCVGHALKGEVDEGQDAALRDDKEIFDSHTRVVVQKLAAGLQSGITNQAREWFKLVTKILSGQESSSERRWFGNATHQLHRVLSQSNFYTSLDEIYTHLGVFGTAAMLMVPDDKSVVRCVVLDTGSFWIAQDQNGRVDTLLRRINMTGRQIKQEFGKDSIPESIQLQLEDGKGETRYTVWNMIYPAEEGPEIPQADAARTFTSVYWLDHDRSKNEGFLAFRGYGYNPIIAPRWRTVGNTVYGCGPGQVGLGDAKELQTVELSILRLVEQASDPAMAAPQSMKGMPLDTGPGGVVYYSPLENGGAQIPVQPLFQTHSAIDGVMQKQAQLKNQLEQIFFTNLFAMIMNLQRGGQARTATEIQELASEKVSLLSPVLSRLNVDLLAPCVEAGMAIMEERAEIELNETGVDPYGVTDTSGLSTGEYEIQYISTLHKEQEIAAKLVGPMRLLEFVSNLKAVSQSPEIDDNLNYDAMVRTAGEVLDDIGVLYDKREVEVTRKTRAEQLEAQQRMAMAQQQAATMQAQAGATSAQAQSVSAMNDASLTNGNDAESMIRRQGFML